MMSRSMLSVWIALLPAAALLMAPACAQLPATDAPSAAASPATPPAAAAATPAPAAATPSLSPEQALWAAYVQHFVQPDGRVVDTGMGGISHSESQGTAMLLAERHDDRVRFDAVWGWTRANLGIRHDALFAWAWRPDAHEHVPDLNNASDGDLLIAWALAEAAQRWQVAAYRDAAVAIAREMLARLVRQTDAGPVLLPGAEGFETAKGLVVNLSYAILPAYRVLDGIAPDPLWHRLSQTAHALEARARFGRFSLPPDWLFVPRGWKAGAPQPALQPWPDKPTRFGFDAIRIPLYLAWSGADGRELWPYLTFWAYFDSLPFHPAWTDLKENAIPMDTLPPGFVSIRRLAEEAAHPGGATPAPVLGAGEDYYSASLTLLASQAWLDRAK